MNILNASARFNLELPIVWQEFTKKQAHSERIWIYLRENQKLAEKSSTLNENMPPLSLYKLKGGRLSSHRPRLCEVNRLRCAFSPFYATCSK